MTTTPWKCATCGGDRYMETGLLGDKDRRRVCTACGGTQATGAQPSGPQPCDACADANACRRLNQCLRYRRTFGEVDKP